MKKTTQNFIGLLALVFIINCAANAQAIEDWTYTPIVTDNNMSIVFPAGTLNDFAGGELMAFNDGGQPISYSSVIAEDGSGGIAAIGTDALCDCDYLSGGDNISFAILINGNIIVDVVVNPSVFYSVNGLVIIDDEVMFNCPDIDEYYNCNVVCINDIDGDEVCDELEILGCTDSLACNFISVATEEDFTCIYDVDVLEYYDCFGFCLSDSDNDGICDELEVIGCTEEWADNYNENATDHDESCYRMGCVSQWADNFDPLATIDDSSCFRIGCSDSTMFNYDTLATEDDGTCIPFIEGCTDTAALNFDSLANTDNQTCILPLSFLGPGDTYNFTNCEQEGRFGPDQSQVNNEYLGTSLEGAVISNDGIQEWVVPNTGLYSIEAIGAAGGDCSYHFTGGSGAFISSEIILHQGQLIQILVGQKGYGYYGEGAGGGGGTFVVSNGEPLIIAGGGGGEAGDNPYEQGFSSEILDVNLNGYGGNGDCGHSNESAGGGGGFIYNGDSNCAQGGYSFLNGGAGADGESDGGFGGGGAQYSDGGGGGGGNWRKWKRSRWWIRWVIMGILKHND